MDVVSKPRVERRRILILGKTAPTFSRTHLETVCSGGIFDNGEVCRIYPVPYRYLEPTSQMRDYQWIDVDVWKDTKDPRPESYHADFQSITVVGNPIPTDKTWQKRRALVRPEERAFPTLEALQESQRTSGTSLGMIQPGRVLGIRAVSTTDLERTEWFDRQEDAFRQFDWLREPKPLDCPTAHYEIEFSCAHGLGCRHTLTTFDWGIAELHRKMTAQYGEESGRGKVVEQLRRFCDLERIDLYLFLGNLRTRLYQFSIMGAFYPPRTTPRAQLGLL